MRLVRTLSCLAFIISTSAAANAEFFPVSTTTTTAGSPIVITQTSVWVENNTATTFRACISFKNVSAKPASFVRFTFQFNDLLGNTLRQAILPRSGSFGPGINIQGKMSVLGGNADSFDNCVNLPVTSVPPSAEIVDVTEVRFEDGTSWKKGQGAQGQAQSFVVSGNPTPALATQGAITLSNTSQYGVNLSIKCNTETDLHPFTLAAGAIQSFDAVAWGRPSSAYTVFLNTKLTNGTTSTSQVSLNPGGPYRIYFDSKLGSMLVETAPPDVIIVNDTASTVTYTLSCPSKTPDSHTIGVGETKRTHLNCDTGGALFLTSLVSGNQITKSFPITNGTLFLIKVDGNSGLIVLDPI